MNRVLGGSWCSACGIEIRGVSYDPLFCAPCSAVSCEGGPEHERRSGKIRRRRLETLHLGYDKYSYNIEGSPRKLWKRNFRIKERRVRW